MPRLRALAIAAMLVFASYSQAADVQQLLAPVQQLQQANRTTDALAACNALIEKHNGAMWLSQPLFLKAQLCMQLQDRVCAQEAIDQIRSEYPQYSEAAHAAVLAAQLSGRGLEIAQRLYQAEQEASVLHLDAMTDYDNGQRTLALTKLRAVVNRWPDTPAALRSYDNMGHVLLKLKRYDEAAEPFLAVLARAAVGSPKSLIVKRAKLRLSAIYRRIGILAEAEDLFNSLSQDSDPHTAGYAARHLMGMEFEQIRDAKHRGEPVSEDRWDRLELRCRTLMQMAVAEPLDRCRGELTLIEVFEWRSKLPELYAAAEVFVQKYSTSSFRRELATAQCFWGEGLIKAGRFAEALPHFETVAEEFPAGKPIWLSKGMQERVHFRVWELRRMTGAPRASVLAAHHSFLQGFPNSSFALQVRLVTQEEERLNAVQPH